jgi:ABC-2 type transport system permease protein
MVSSQEDVQQASMPVMLLLVSSVIFIAPILTNPGSPLARTMTLLPFSAPILMPLRMSLMTVPWYELAGSLGGVAIACALSIWLSARIYRVGLLMYGKRPSFRELARWVRYAG